MTVKRQTNKKRPASGEVKQTYSRSEITQAWIPWAVLSVIVFVWGTQTGKIWMNTPEKVFPSTASWSTKPSQITNPQFPVTSSAQPG